MNILVTQKHNFIPKRVTPTCGQPTLNTNMLPLFHSELLLSTFFYHVRFLQAIWREGIMPRSTKEQKAAFAAWPGCTMCSKKLCDCNGMRFNHYLFLKPSSKQEEEEEKCIECQSSGWSRSGRMMFSHGFTCYWLAREKSSFSVDVQ